MAVLVHGQWQIFFHFGQLLQSHAQAEALQRATQALPDAAAETISEKAEELLETADALLEKGEELEQQSA